MSKESARASAEHRKAVVAAARKAEQRRRRVRTTGLIAGMIAVAAAVVVIIVIVVTRPTATPSSAQTPLAGKQIIPAASVGAKTTQAPATRVANTSGITGVLAWDTTGWPGDGAAHTGALEHTHVAGPVSYDVVPPVGGPHNPVWMNAGVYTTPIPSERAVHNLEHGAVWITYNPNLPAAEVAALTAFVTRQTLIAEPASAVGISNDSNRYVDLSPWATNALPSPIVISSWGYQLRVTSPTDPRLQKFVDTFRDNQKYRPEFGAPVDGIPILTGGRPALDGGTQPNPAGSAAN
jgi:hypothetical protein